MDQTCRRIHFLHATAWTVAAGATIAKYVIRLSDGTQQTMPVVYGRHLQHWLSFTGGDQTVSDARIAWQSPLPKLKDRQTTLYVAAWDNPNPSIPVASIDFVSEQSDAAPFLLAITLEQ